jgi:pyridoxine/pyridoxamine 5'-phosphate oxidase
VSEVDTGAVARRLVDTIQYMTIATADAEGRPWISPVWFASASATEFLWVSSLEARHSRNIAVRPEIAIVVFDSTVPVGGAEALYVEARADQVEDVDDAIAVFSRRSVAVGAQPWGPGHVLPPARLRLYRAAATSQSVLGPGDERLPFDPSG